PAVVDDLGDRGRPAAGVVIGEEGERADLPGAVARLALLLDDRRDVAGVRHRAGRLRGGADLLHHQGIEDRRRGRADPGGAPGRPASFSMGKGIANSWAWAATSAIDSEALELIAAKATPFGS